MDKQPGGVKRQLAPGKVRRWVRRRIIVNPAFQLRTLVPLLVFAVLQALLLGLFLFYPLHRSAAGDPDPVVHALLGEQILNVHVRLWPLLVFSAILSCIYTLVRSNRVAGPLYKLRQSLMRMTEGEYRNMRFRKGDEFREFEAVTERLARRMEALASGNLRKISKIESRIRWLKTRLEMQDLPKIDVERELDAVLAECGQAQILREDM